MLSASSNTLDLKYILSLVDYDTTCLRFNLKILTLELNRFFFWKSSFFDIQVKSILSA